MTEFETMTGRVRIHPARCSHCQSKPCIPACPEDILALRDGAPVLARDAREVRKGLCRECLACEIACLFEGARALTVLLPIEGLAR